MSAMVETEDNHHLLDQPRRILFPTDFGQAAQATWSYALALAKALAAELLVLHVVRLVPADLQLCTETMGIETVEESLRRAAEVPLERMRAEAGAAGVPMRTDVVVGRVRTEIVRVAQEAGATLIVMGTSGREGLRRALLGSIAEWVVGHAPCPVWTVRYAAPSMVASPQEEIEAEHERSVVQRSARV